MPTHYLEITSSWLVDLLHSSTPASPTSPAPSSSPGLLKMVTKPLLSLIVRYIDCQSFSCLLSVILADLTPPC